MLKKQKLQTRTREKQNRVKNKYIHIARAQLLPRIT